MAAKVVIPVGWSYEFSEVANQPMVRPGMPQRYVSLSQQKKGTNANFSSSRSPLGRSAPLERDSQHRHFPYLLGGSVRSRGHNQLELRAVHLVFRLYLLVH